MFLAIFLALVAVAAGYLIHKKLSLQDAIKETPISKAAEGGSKREKLATSKRGNVDGVSNRVSLFLSWGYIILVVGLIWI